MESKRYVPGCDFPAEIRQKELQKSKRIPGKNHTTRTETYPKTPMDAYAILQNYQIPRKVDRTYGNEGVTFAQEGIETDIIKVKLFSCEKMGHYFRGSQRRKK